MFLSYLKLWLLLFGSLRVIFGFIIYWNEYGISLFNNTESNVKPFKRIIGLFYFITGIIYLSSSISIKHISSVLICLIITAIELFQLHNEFFAFKSFKSKSLGYDIALITLFQVVLLSIQLGTIGYNKYYLNI